MTELAGSVQGFDTYILKAEDPRAIKINSLKKFCGNRTKLHLYLFRLNIYIRLNPLKFRITEKCILFTAFYFKKKAYKWFELYLSNYINYTPDNYCQEIDQMFASYYKFKTKINKVFKKIDKKRVAERKLLFL